MTQRYKIWFASFSKEKSIYIYLHGRQDRNAVTHTFEILSKLAGKFNGWKQVNHISKFLKGFEAYNFLKIRLIHVLLKEEAEFTPKPVVTQLSILE